MKIKILILSLFIIAFSSVAYAQSVTITPKKVTYKRPKPSADFKKSFTVNYPKVKAKTPALSKKIETAISYETVNGLNIKEEINEIQWLEEADYEVLYNKNDLLAISLWLSGSGAYPSVSSKTVVVDLTNGALLKASDVFTNLEALAAELKKQQTAEIENAKKEIRETPDSSEVNTDELFQNSDFTAENIDEFSIGDDGVTFYYDYGFPHVIQALAPNGRYSLSWTQIKPFIKKESALEKFVK